MDLKKNQTIAPQQSHLYRWNTTKEVSAYVQVRRKAAEKKHVRVHLRSTANQLSHNRKAEKSTSLLQEHTSLLQSPLQRKWIGSILPTLCGHRSEK